MRYVFVAAAGPVVLCEYSDGEFLSAHSEEIDEIRPTTSLLPLYAGGRGGEGVKLEQQLLVTESGPEVLDDCPLGLV